MLFIPHTSLNFLMVPSINLDLLQHFDNGNRHLWFSNPIYHSNEYIIKDLNTPNYPWYYMNHHDYFLPRSVFTINKSFDQFSIKYCIALRHVDCFKNPIPTLNSFEEGNISNISPIIKVDISINPIIIEHILFGVYYSLEGMVLTKPCSKKYVTFFPSLIMKCRTWSCYYLKPYWYMD